MQHPEKKKAKKFSSLTMLPLLAFVAAWTRFALLGRRGAVKSVEYYLSTRKGSMVRDGNFLAFFFSGCCIIFIIVLSIFLDDFPPDYRSIPAFSIITIMIGVLVGLRFLFMLPAGAIGHKTTAGTAWRQSKGIALRLFCILFLVTLPFNVLQILIGSLSATETAGRGVATGEIATVRNLLFAVSHGFVLFLGLGVLVAAVCLSYQHAVDGHNQTDAEVTSASDWVVHLFLPVLLALFLGVVGYWIAVFLNFPADGRGLLACAAFLITLIWKVYRLEDSSPD